MNKRFKHSLRVFSGLLLIIFSLFGQALAESAPVLTQNAAECTVVWCVTAARLDAAALHQAAFDQTNGDPVICERVRNDGSLFWWPEGVTGAPFCSVGSYPEASGVQNEFDIVRHDDMEHTYLYRLDSWNTIWEESGENMPQKKEVLEKATELLWGIGLGGGH
ncbi:MAG: hypothetical protein IJ174_02740, partial [Clostridia bacterium]|nr:hypothetical protein [Clostridia bacterium]